MNGSTGSLEVVTAPAWEPVSRAEAKRWLRIGASVTEHDLVIDLLVKAMREAAENLTQRAYIQRTLRLTLCDYPWGGRYGPKIVLPLPPLVSVSSFKYIDADGVLQTLAASQYAVYDEFQPAYITPEWQVTWPTIRAVPNALQVTYVAGYPAGSPQDEAASQEAMPAALRLWMEQKLATHFEFREAIVAGVAVNEIPKDFTDRLLDPLVVGTRLF